MLEYHGGVPEVIGELEAKRADLIDAYRRLLGERFATVGAASSSLLAKPASFQMPTIHGDPVSVHEAHPTDTFFTCETALDEGAFRIAPTGQIVVQDGRLRAPTTLRLVITASGIDGFWQVRRNRAFPRYLTPYLHEYDHFVTFCLQDIPCQVASNIVGLEMRKRGLPTFTAATFGILLERYRTSVMSLGLYVLAWYLQLVSEALARTFDARLLTELGYDGAAYLEWRTPIDNHLAELRPDEISAAITQWHHTFENRWTCLRSLLRSEGQLDLFRQRYRFVEVEKFVRLFLRSLPSVSVERVPATGGVDGYGALSNQLCRFFPLHFTSG